MMGLCFSECLMAHVMVGALLITKSIGAYDECGHLQEL